MGDVTPKGYPYPTGDDLVMDGDNAIQALAEAIDARLPAAIEAGVANISVKENTIKTTTVTFAAGLFTVSPEVVDSLKGSNAPSSIIVSTTAVGTTSFGLKAHNTTSSDRDATVSWHAIQQTGEATQLQSDDNDATVTCPTMSCSNRGVEISVPTTYPDDTGQNIPADGVICGVCGTEISNTLVLLDGGE